jgi:hypothetical protein
VNWKTLSRIVLKALALFLAANLLLALCPPQLPLGRLSAYNLLFPGRPRFPFGENPEKSYNLSLYDLEAMFAAHEVSAPPARDEFRVFIAGDSSVWGTLLRPEQTLSGQLNAAGLRVCGRPARFYNLGYPTLSLTKDLMILDRARSLQPDLIIWLVTLESFPRDRQFSSPLVANNAPRIAGLIQRDGLAYDPRDPNLLYPNFWERTLIGRRRALADLARLQFYGLPWAATAVDQFYPPTYEPAQRDLDADTAYHDLPGPQLPAAYLAADVLTAGMRASASPVLLVNEPILVSSGQNSSLWYNFFYPRWAYDAYRSWLSAQAASAGWHYLDAWDAVPEEEFTNSAIHLTPAGQTILAGRLEKEILTYACP